MAYAEFGGSRSGFFTCGVASLQLFPHNPQRRKLIIVNDSVTPCYFSKGRSAAVVGSGITLLAGGVWIVEPDNQGYIWKGAIQCISTLAARNISWSEDW